MWWGLDAGKYFWRSGREECFSLDIPFNRTSEHNPGCLDLWSIPMSCVASCVGL